MVWVSRVALLALLLITELYPFVLPYAAKWYVGKGARRSAERVKQDNS